MPVTGLDFANLQHMLFDADSGGDILLFIRSMGVYVFLRVVCEYALPGKIRGYTKQQYVMTLFHQALVLPIVALGWAFGIWAVSEGPILVYVLTGAHMVSDSIINYSPVSGCVAGADGKPTFSWGVHAHHIFTIFLCALGTTLPPWPIIEGAICILLGEAGSLWITVTMLRPNRANFLIRYYAFVATRVCGVLISLDIMRQVPWVRTRVLLLLFTAGLVYDNYRTLAQMTRGMKAHEAERLRTDTKAKSQ